MLYAVVGTQGHPNDLTKRVAEADPSDSDPYCSCVYSSTDDDHQQHLAMERTEIRG